MPIPRSLAFRTSIAVFSFGAVWAAASSVPAAEGHVIPPGNEKVIATMLGDQTRLPGSCTLAGIKVDKAFVEGRYRCAEAIEGTVELRHIEEAPSAALKTAKFALVVQGKLPPELTKALVERVSSHEGEFRWVTPVEGQPVRRPAGPGPTPPPASPDQFTPEEWATYQKGTALYRDGEVREALDVFVNLAKSGPKSGVLGMVVASLASTSPTRDDVARRGAEADKDPTNLLNQFLAGVAAHYCGHRNATTRDEKAELYTTAIKYLERTLPAYEKEPRVHIYLAISHFRLGHQKEAEQFIERAVALGSHDADAFYCRAEVFQRVDIKRAIKDIETYLEITERLKREEGAPLSESKQVRVREMLAHLKAVERGDAAPADLFDPLPSGIPALMRPLSPRAFAGLTVGVGAFAGLVWLLVARRKRSRKTDAVPTA